MISGRIRGMLTLWGLDPPFLLFLLGPDRVRDEKLGPLVGKTTILEILSSKQPHQDFFGHLGSEARVHLQEPHDIGQILLPLARTLGPGRAGGTRCGPGACWTTGPLDGFGPGR